MKKRTCHELGVCQGDAPGCTACSVYPYAPGTIDGPHSRTKPASLVVKVLSAIVGLVLGSLLGTLVSMLVFWIFHPEFFSVVFG